MEIEVNDKNFEEKVIKGSKDKPVVVDFWASWCQPCLMLGPNLEKVMKENEDKIVLAKCNVDKAKASATKYGVRSIPSVKMFKDGEVVDEFVGALPESKIKEWVDKNLK